MAGGVGVYGDHAPQASDLGRWAVFAGYPVGVGVVGGLVLLILGGRSISLEGEWFSAGMTSVLVFSLLLLPYSIAGGVMEGLYGRRVGGLPCCTFVIAGAAVAYALPLAVAGLAGLYAPHGRFLAWAAGGLVAQVLVAVVAWWVVRNRVAS